jgi:coagulation factor V (labile factor)
LQDFEGNSDCTAVKMNTLKIPVETRFMRIVPKSWKEKVALKVQFYGCPVHQVPGKISRE